MEQIILSISVFTALVLVLVLILNFAESQLLPQGSVTIELNNEPDKSSLFGLSSLILTGNDLLFVSILLAVDSTTPEYFLRLFPEKIGL